MEAFLTSSSDGLISLDRAHLELVVYLVRHKPLPVDGDVPDPCQIYNNGSTGYTGDLEGCASGIYAP